MPCSGPGRRAKILWGLGALSLAAGLLVGAPMISQHRERSRTEGGSRFFKNGAARRMASAMSKTDTAAMRRIAASGLDLNAVGEEGATLLAFGIQYAPSAVPLLLDLGADSRFAPPNVDLPVAQAVYSASAALVPLLRKGAPPVDRAGEQLVFYAIRQDQGGIVDLLLAYGADVKATDRNGFSMLMRAAERRLWMNALTMLDRGADPRYVSPDGHSLALVLDDQLSRLDATDRVQPEYVELRRRLEALGVRLAAPLPIPKVV